MRKYGIEPLQSLQSTQSPIKHESNLQSTTYTIKPESQQQSSGYTNYQTPMYNEQKNLNEPNKFQNYSQILRDYEGKPGNEQERKEGAKRSGFEPTSYSQYEEIPPTNNYNNYAYNNNNNNNDYNINQRPGYDHERKEGVKRGGFEPSEYRNEDIQVRNYETNQINEYKPSIIETSDNQNSSYDFYNKPSDMNVQTSYGYNQTKIVDSNIKPSLYDNTSFSHEFYDTKNHESKIEELKKKSSLSEMKKSINNPGIFIIILIITRFFNQKQMLKKLLLKTIRMGLNMKERS